jgi:hypothetical protein
MPKAKRALSTPAAAPKPAHEPRLDCEDDFNTIADGMATLWMIWDSIANGTIGGHEIPQTGLHFVIKRMHDAGKSLGPKLGLEDRSEDEKEGQANG